MPRVSYYASRIAPDKPHQVETPEGFRIYLTVPICRTGFQEYAGRELRYHPDFKEEWGISNEDIVTVYRPREVVTAPETLASFEGKSVTDNHPPNEVAIVMIGNESEYGKGHAQNVRVGEETDDGETTLVADLFVTNQELNDKIDSGIREVSCGYTYSLARNDSGTLVMTRICGNHLAVVPKGRAGSEIAIQDALQEPQLIVSGISILPASSGEQPSIRQDPEKTQRKPMKDKKGSILGRMLKAFAASDADPEEIAEAAKLASKDEEPPFVKNKAEDSDPNTMSEPELHPRLAEACDSIAHMRAGMDSLMEKLAPKPEDEPSLDANVLEMTPEEDGKAVLSSDSAAFLTLVKPLVAASKNKTLKDSFIAHFSSLKGASSGENVYAQLADMIARDSTTDEVDPMKFFSGVSYQEGRSRYESHLATKGNK